jgi:uncharacterized PurR-regulated membrane protein YhhQ (DUF165 family)
MSFLIIYVGLITLINIGFHHVPLIPLFGEMWPPLSLAVGFIFIARDLAQRWVGHWVWLGMILGCILSWLMADPFIAVASATAFIVSEAIDWAVYTWTKKPLRQRILISSTIAAPIDSVIFLSMIGHLSTVGAAMMIASKMVAVAVVWKFIDRVK